MSVSIHRCMITQIVLGLVLIFALTNVTNSTISDCPIIDGEYHSFDLLERSWCHQVGIPQP